MHPNTLFKAILAIVVGATFVFAACNPSQPTGTAGTVSCQEDEVAQVRQWTPGTPKEGLIWDCVHIDLLFD